MFDRYNLQAYNSIVRVENGRKLLTSSRRHHAYYPGHFRQSSHKHFVIFHQHHHRHYQPIRQLVKHKISNHRASIPLNSAHITLITIALLYFYTNKSRIQARRIKNLKKQEKMNPLDLPVLCDTGAANFENL